MGVMNLKPRKPPFHVEVQADQSEGQPDRLCLFVRGLRHPRIDDELVNEGGIFMRERIAIEFVVSIQLRLRIGYHGGTFG